MTDGREVRFEKLRRDELEAYAGRSTIVLIPVGAIEQHGPHLPVEMDTRAATTFAVDAARSLDDVLVAPAVPWGLSNAHIGLGATITLRPSTMLDLALDITDSLIRSGFKRLVWVNGHHGNRGILSTIVYETKRLHGLSAGAVTYYELALEAFNAARRSELGGAGHACEFETSLLLHLDPDAVGAYESISFPLVPLTSYDVRDISSMGPAMVGYTFDERFPDGVMGDPSKALPETGKVIYDAALPALVEFLEQFRSSWLVNESAART
jgi:creatinine amidohydrolase